MRLLRTLRMKVSGAISPEKVDREVSRRSPSISRCGPASSSSPERLPRRPAGCRRRIRRRHPGPGTVPRLARPRRRSSLLAQDVRYGWRMIARSPGSALVAVVTLGLGIGINAAFFSAVNAILLRPLPFARENWFSCSASRSPGAGVENAQFSPPEVRDLEAQSRTPRRCGGVPQHGVHALGHGDPIRVRTGVVSRPSSTCSACGRRLADLPAGEDGHRRRARSRDLARFLAEHARRRPRDRREDVRDERPRPYRRRRAPGSSAIPGRERRTCRCRHARSGPGPSGTRPGAPTDSLVFARLRAGRRSRSRARAVAHRGTPEEPVSGNVPGRRPFDLRRELAARRAPRATLRLTFVALLATAGFVLLIACANVANLTLARLPGASASLRSAPRSAPGAAGSSASS